MDALPFVAPRTRRMLDVVCRQPSTIDLMVEKEAARRRVVAETSRWVAFVPESARWPVELHLCPRGVFVNDVSPGQMAARLRDVVAS